MSTLYQHKQARVEPTQDDALPAYEEAVGTSFVGAVNTESFADGLSGTAAPVSAHRAAVMEEIRAAAPPGSEERTEGRVETQQFTKPGAPPVTVTKETFITNTTPASRPKHDAPVFLNAGNTSKETTTPRVLEAGSGSPPGGNGPPKKNRRCPKKVWCPLLIIGVIGILVTCIYFIVVGIQNKKARYPKNLYGELVVCRSTDYTKTIPQAPKRHSIKALSKSKWESVNAITIEDKSNSFNPYTNQCEHKVDPVFFQPLAYSPLKETVSALGPFQVKIEKGFKKGAVPAYQNRLAVLDKNGYIPINKYPIPPPLVPFLLDNSTQSGGSIYCLIKSTFAKENPAISALEHSRQQSEDDDRRRKQEEEDEERRRRESSWSDSSSYVPPSVVSSEGESDWGRSSWDIEILPAPEAPKAPEAPRVPEAPRAPEAPKAPVAPAAPASSPYTPKVEAPPAWSPPKFDPPPYSPSDSYLPDEDYAPPPYSAYNPDPPPYSEYPTYAPPSYKEATGWKHKRSLSDRYFGSSSSSSEDDYYSSSYSSSSYSSSSYSPSSYSSSSYSSPSSSSWSDSFSSWVTDVLPFNWKRSLPDRLPDRRPFEEPNPLKRQSRRFAQAPPGAKHLSKRVIESSIYAPMATYTHVSAAEREKMQKEWDGLLAEVKSYRKNELMWRLMPSDGFTWRREVERSKKGEEVEGWECWVGGVVARE
ncbi:hypothetical protein BJ508DRAFT_380572 [Ascobolus immersus RN42]|uniref:Uncharacterized protein n=1 Tax=Ascobolus immersus RN42 TaxID=1160509 RepID=A0A3N4HMH0_ASCIM|nr:hypothetical protein BJ508DRAFT_380572 [Ascobolus immersus RN42]